MFCRFSMVAVLCALLFAVSCPSLGAGNGAGEDGGEVVTGTIELPPAGPLTSRGVKHEIASRSGDRLQVWWKAGWLGEGRIIPRWYFELQYIDGTMRETFPVGECHFSGGCNRAVYSAYAAGKGDTAIVRFVDVVWESWGYGGSGEGGVIEMFTHRFNVPSRTYTVTKSRYRYPSTCIPPVSIPPDVCAERPGCEPPFRLEHVEVVSTELVSGGPFRSGPVRNFRED